MVTAPRALLTRKTTFKVCRPRLAKKRRAVRARPPRTPPALAAKAPLEGMPPEVGKEVLGGQRQPHQHLDHVEALAEAEAARVLGIGGRVRRLVGHGSGL